jgi:hypothetical protein
MPEEKAPAILSSAAGCLSIQKSDLDQKRLNAYSMPLSAQKVAVYYNPPCIIRVTPIYSSI